MTGPAGAAAPGLVALIQSIADDPRRPRLVCYTADGARTELSGGSLANWTAKVAGLMRDELGLGVGDIAVVSARTGWQLAAVLLGCWWAGLTVTDAAPDAAVAFVDPGGDADADEVFVLSGHPLGAPATDIAAHQRDFTTATLPQSDRPGPPGDAGGGWVAIDAAGTAVTASALADAAHGAAARLDHGTPGRPVLLSTVPWDLPEGVSRTLLGALAADGALVQCATELADAELAVIAQAEHATGAVGRGVTGLPLIQ